MTEQQNKEMGVRLAKLRRSSEMTQEDLAEIRGVTTKHVSHVERGKAALSLRHLVKLSDMYNCSLDYLIMGKPHDQALAKLPKAVFEIMYSGNDQEIDLLIRYLNFFCELQKK